MPNISREELLSQLIAIRHAIRTHRDQVGDYRCWVDDEVLYHRFLPELEGYTAILPSSGEFHSFCVAYYEKRQDPAETDTIEIPLDSSIAPLELNYDNQIVNRDLESKNDLDLINELTAWVELIRAHREKGPLDRTFEDDLTLYLFLPEKKRAITKLPRRADFIGRNCPAYNRHCHEHPEDFIEGVWGTAKAVKLKP